jgi:hypothetical protein
MGVEVSRWMVIESGRGAWPERPVVGVFSDGRIDVSDDDGWKQC